MLSKAFFRISLMFRTHPLASPDTDAVWFLLRHKHCCPSPLRSVNIVMHSQLCFTPFLVWKGKEFSLHSSHGVSSLFGVFTKSSMNALTAGCDLQHFEISCQRPNFKGYFSPRMPCLQYLCNDTLSGVCWFFDMETSSTSSCVVRPCFIQYDGNTSTIRKAQTRVPH